MGSLTSEDILFHGFAAAATLSALLVILLSNPIYSALFLALSMSVLGAVFFVLNGYFISVAQITVYAGAVMVLFIMVLMLFDLKRDDEQILKASPMIVAKVLSAALLCGFLVGTGWLALSLPSGNLATQVAPLTKPGDLAKDTQAVPPVAQQIAENPDLKDAPDTNAAGATANGNDADEDHELRDHAQRDQVKAVNPDEDLTAAEAASLVEKNLAASNQPGELAGQMGTAADDPATPGGEMHHQTSSQMDAIRGLPNDTTVADAEFGSTKSLSRRLFTKYVFAFEAVSLLLLVAIVGAVALAKSRGGTHHAV